MKTLKAKNLKSGATWSKYGINVFYANGFVVSTFEFKSIKFATLKEAKQFIHAICNGCGHKYYNSLFSPVAL